MLAAIQENFWATAPHSQRGYIMMAVAFAVGLALIVACLFAPTRARKPIVWTVTFLAGFYWVLFYFLPEPINRKPTDVARNAFEGFAFVMADGNAVAATVANSVGAFLFGLGIYSLLRIHTNNVLKKRKNWFFSLMLILSLICMVAYGYGNWWIKQHNPGLIDTQARWQFPNYAFDIMFDGLLQQMDAVMFSLVAFYILSAAYRAFRIRSIESTVLMASALLMMLSLMGAVDFAWSGVIGKLAHGDPNSFLNNFTLTSVSNWVKANLQVPSLRALDFGIGLGGLAMALRIWLGLEKGGVTV